ncbi:unnamed protein product [Cyclocybe aegerita]|uniref:DNA mismatch repair protein MSH3 n=1 Tax=Cyclocybe aegerita TaxID=1973307 RepID=A0A8S0W0J5_CYCAE|nr:unnamed protein product [Cyclocybe aegerita]
MTRSQSSISSYFQAPASSPSKSQKRFNSPIDLTLDDDEPVPKKRPRLSESASSSPVKIIPKPASSKSGTTVAQDWRFSLERVKDDTRPSKQRTGPEQERHEAFERKLLQDNSRFFPRFSKGNEFDEVDRMGADEPEGSGQDSDGDSDSRFKKLSELFANKDKGKAKATIKNGPQSKRTRKAAREEMGPSGKPYTPLEKQVLKLKEDNPGTVLMIEVGYKYKFFGKDAEVARKELGMVAYVDRNFLVAGIPDHRRDVHLKKLLSCGYRVGIVSQTETAALKKVGDNRNAPFTREVTRLYTAATYVDEMDSVDDMEKYTSAPFMCLVEEKKNGKSSDVSFGMIIICPSTGDIVWDDFEDSVMRLELETRLVHNRPSELLVPRKHLTDATNKMLSHFTGISTTGSRIRTDEFDEVMDYTDAFEKVSQFYTDERKSATASESFKSGKLMASVVDFPKRVVVALAHAIEHLSAFGIANAFLETKFFTKFSTRAHMLLAANTLINLEIYRNETDGTTRGSLMWVLDRTKTKFGARLLRSWVGRPLVDKVILQARVDAVEEILESTSETLLTLRGLLKRLPDLAKGLCRIQYGQCTPKELSVLLLAFKKIADAYDDFDSPASVGLKSGILNEIISSLPKLKEPVRKLLEIVNLKKAADGKRDEMWNDRERYPDIVDADMSLQCIDHELADELKAIRKTLRMPSLNWITFATDEYLVEVVRNENRPIPDNWILHSKTKKLARYQPPSVHNKVQERNQRRETLDAASNQAYHSFLKEISQDYYAMLRDAVNKIAVADCLISLAQVALQLNYVRPEFTDDNSLEIVDGRHPMIEIYSDTPHVPNSIKMGDGAARSKIVTGPNMGGKSSCVRMIALIALMAQIGSYVPAASVKMGLLDSILTRMGASDDLARGRSTFMVEMSETSEILQMATNRSLVILDELGRGTSTFDGMAIADATLQYLVDKTKCKTLFITHYPLVATKLAKRFPADVENIHMGYDSETRIDGTRNITFLYRLSPGLATESFGIECGRLAKVPEDILSVATERSAQMQEEVQERIRCNRRVDLSEPTSDHEGLTLLIDVEYGGHHMQFRTV